MNTIGDGSVDVHGVGGRSSMPIGPAMTLALDPANMAEATAGGGVPGRGD